MGRPESWNRSSLKQSSRKAWAPGCQHLFFFHHYLTTTSYACVKAELGCVLRRFHYCRCRAAVASGATVIISKSKDARQPAGSLIMMVLFLNVGNCLQLCLRLTAPAALGSCVHALGGGACSACIQDSRTAQCWIECLHVQHGLQQSVELADC